MTAGVFVDHIVEAAERDKPIEQRTTRPRDTAPDPAAGAAGEEI